MRQAGALMNFSVKSIGLRVFWNDKGGDVGEGLGLGCPTSQRAVTTRTYQLYIRTIQRYVRDRLALAAHDQLFRCQPYQFHLQ